MSSATHETTHWTPETPADRDLITWELNAILSSSHFSGSKRYPALLKYVVSKALDGHSEELKERTLGVEVFDRSPDYDTNADPVVRFSASEVRSGSRNTTAKMARVRCFRFTCRWLLCAGVQAEGRRASRFCSAAQPFFCGGQPLSFCSLWLSQRIFLPAKQPRPEPRTSYGVKLLHCACPRSHSRRHRAILIGRIRSLRRSTRRIT